MSQAKVRLWRVLLGGTSIMEVLFFHIQLQNIPQSLPMLLSYQKQEVEKSIQKPYRSKNQTFSTLLGASWFGFQLRQRLNYWRLLYFLCLSITSCFRYDDEGICKSTRMLNYVLQLVLLSISSCHKSSRCKQLLIRNSVC